MFQLYIHNYMVFPPPVRILYFCMAITVVGGNIAPAGSFKIRKATVYFLPL